MGDKAVVVTIGNELLIGQTIDTNSAFLAQHLMPLGITIERKITVGDRTEHITSALAEAERYGGVILITGGLGPTSDDCTKQALAAYYRRPLVHHEAVMQAVEAHFRRLGRSMPEINRNQALLPERSTLLANAYGTAWGIWIEEDGRHIIALPGVPFEMKPMFLEQVVPELRRRLQLPPVLTRTLHVFGLGESALAERIADLEVALPAGMSLAYLPHYSVVRLRLTAAGAPEEQLREMLNHAEQQLRQRLGSAIFGEDNTSLEEALGKSLLSAGKTLAVAESCTGGALAARIVEVAGASAYFLGGVVGYHNQVKLDLLQVPESLLEQYGAVSEPVVIAMLLGLLERIPADYAAAISGIAGPEGGTADKPVGTVWMATGRREQYTVRRFQFRGSRIDVINYAVMNALGLLLQQVRAEASADCGS